MVQMLATGSFPPVDYGFGYLEERTEGKRVGGANRLAGTRLAVHTTCTLSLAAERRLVHVLDLFKICLVTVRSPWRLGARRRGVTCGLSIIRADPRPSPCFLLDPAQ